MRSSADGFFHACDCRNLQDDNFNSFVHFVAGSRQDARSAGTTRISRQRQRGFGTLLNSEILNNLAESGRDFLGLRRRARLRPVRKPPGKNG